MSMGKFYIVCYEIKDDVANQYRKQTFTKSDLYWFGVDEKIAQQKFRSLVRTTGTNYIPHIKCIDLDELPDYLTPNKNDKQANIIAKNVVNRLRFSISTKATTSSKGMLTYSFTSDKIFEAKPNYKTGERNTSMIHDSKISRNDINEDAYNKILPIIIQKYMDDIEIITPFKLKVDGKLIKKYEPNEK